MGEFLDVIHQTKRICKSVNGNCGKCLLGAFSCPNNARFDSTDEQKFIDFANAVMTWAAEHPVVYPTWEEWLVANGIMEPDNVRLNGDYRFYYEGKPVYNIPSPKMFDPIPADIAQKLGIEPKEGT